MQRINENMSCAIIAEVLGDKKSKTEVLSEKKNLDVPVSGQDCCRWLCSLIAGDAFPSTHPVLLLLEFKFILSVCLLF